MEIMVVPAFWNFFIASKSSMEADDIKIALMLNQLGINGVQI